MPQLSAEAVLLSALLNNQDVLAGQKYGLSVEHFFGYKSEYQWLLNYVENYKCEPSKDAFSVAFPNFQYHSHEDVRSACDMVFKAYGKKNLTSAMTEAAEFLALGDLDVAYKTLVDAQPLRTHAKPKRLLTDLDFLDDWEKPQTVLHTPYNTLNRVTGGMRPGQLWYFAARPGQGKSAHLVNMVAEAVRAGARVKFYSLEMSEAEVRARFHALLANHYGYKGISLTGIRDRTVDLHTYKQFVTELQDKMEDTGGGLDIHTPAQGLVTPGLISNTAENYHLNVVDYIGLMRQVSGSRAVDDWRNLASISNDLKLIAGSCATTLLVASKINREGETREGIPPRLVNLAGSDALGQDGDVVITLAGIQNVTSALSVEKNRHGPSARFYTEFDPDRGNFKEITADEADARQMEAMAR